MADQHSNGDGNTDSTETTDSLSSQVTGYHFENGRRYHKFKEGTYLFPNDEREIERLELQHQLFHLILSGHLHFAPLNNPERILDVGTGTGDWVVEMADLYPNAQVEGTDLSPIQSSNVPENARFLIDDALEPDWTLSPPAISYIHARMMAGSFRDHRTLLATAFSNLSSNGYFESQEMYPTPYLCSSRSPLPSTYALRKYIDTLDEAFMALPKPIRVANKLAKWYREAGFIDVHEEVFDVPLGSWHSEPRMKRIGQVNLRIWEEGISGWAMAVLTRFMGWSMTEVEVWLVDVREALRLADEGQGEHVFFKCYVVWGRKP